ncbi:MAG: hypothetical protein DI536_15965 [Archangium gephyra]|uniref:SAF domain-containing protein n=1 Tax=Archangium gephyra TaxID=48 RepID=A0A2W5TAD4_9BACT|nr:MAG: hypothetical protein DI536_15965 [Archangium gephyra]
MSEERSTFTTGLLAGVSAGVVLLVLCSLGIVFWARRSTADVKKGWVLVPVLVATTDVLPRTRLAREHVEVRAMPEQFVTPASVKPEQLGEVLGRPLRFVLAKGEMLTFPRVELGGVAYFARKDLAAGAPFDVDDFEARRVEADAFTVWTVREGQLEQLKGAAYERGVRSGTQLTLSDVSAIPPKP